MSGLSILNFNNANSRDTYFTVHNVKEAHMLSKGKGVKGGIIKYEDSKTVEEQDDKRSKYLIKAIEWEPLDIN
jgi:hypothetical protein